MESLGGASLSGIGFGLGTDRTLLACEAESLDVAADGLVDVFVVPIGQRPARGRGRGDAIAWCRDSGGHGLR